MRFTVMILEDVEPDAMLVMAYLKKSGIQAHQIDWIQSLGDVELALSKRQPDLVFTDLGLPDATSVDAVRVLRDAMPAVPIVPLTGQIRLDIAILALNAGAFDFITKDSLSIRNVRQVLSALPPVVGGHHRESEKIASVALIMLNCERRLEYMTAAAQSALGLSEKPSPGSSLDELIGNQSGTDTLLRGIEQLDPKGCLSEVPVLVGRGINRRNYIAHCTRLRDEWIYVKLLTAGAGKALTAGEALVGTSHAANRLRENISRMSSGSWPVLVEGETGVGKGLVARLVHEHSDRRNGPLIALNCAGLQRADVDLFSRVPSAPSSSGRDIFSQARGGSLLLKKIDELSLELQGIVLANLQQPSRDVRLIATTRQNLATLVKKKLFREDLFYLIRVGRIYVPSLDERDDDALELCRHFFKQSPASDKNEEPSLPTKVISLIREHHWPGNVSELKNAIDFAAIQQRPTETLSIDHFPPEIPRDQKQSCDERRLLEQALKESMGNRKLAARRLGVSRATLYRMLKRNHMGMKRQ